MVIWLIGLSGAGKTTIGKKLYDRFHEQYSNTVFLDGDMLRDIWGDSLSHDIEGRRINAHRISHLSAMLDKQGINVVAAVLSIFPEWQEWNRKEIENYFEVFLDVPFNIVKERDFKGIYKKTECGETNNVVGIDIPFPKPEKSDIVLSSPDVLRQPDEIVENILSNLKISAFLKHESF